MSGPQTLRVDWTECRARGHCIERLPELLTADPWGYPVPAADLRTPRGEIMVPERLHAAAEQAVDGCPRLALQLRRQPPA